MPAVLEKEYIQPMSPVEAKYWAYVTSGSHANYLAKLDALKLNIVAYFYEEYQEDQD